MQELTLENLRPHLGNLNYVLKDYGVSVEVMVDENNKVVFKDGHPEIQIGPAHDWTDYEVEVIEK